MSVTERDPLVGQVIGDCLFKRQIGKGGMGVVYLGTHQTLQIPVAVKVLPESFASNTQFLERFYREARQAARLDHPNIVRVLNVGETAGRHFLVMRYVDGPSLADMMDHSGIFDPMNAAEIMIQCLRGLDYAHRHGCIHRDIKPDNIMVDSERLVKITDFGLARQRDQDTGLTNTGQIIGTPPFMPLEQWDNVGVDHRVDLFAVGASFYILITGGLPYPGETASLIWRRILDGALVPVRERRNSVDKKLEAIVHKMLEPHKEDRYASAREALQELDAWHTEAINAGDSPAKLRITTLIERLRPDRIPTDPEIHLAIDEVPDAPPLDDVPEIEQGFDSERATRIQTPESQHDAMGSPARRKSGISDRIISPVPVVVGVREATPAFPIPGARLRDFLLQECVGRGGHGEVWRAQIASTGEIVTVKIPRSEGGIAALREGFTALQPFIALGAHPHVVGLKESHLGNVPPFLVFEYFDGQTVKDRVTSRGPLSAMQTVAVLSQVADALGAAHQMQIAHRSLTPRCVLIDRDDHIRVIDFAFDDPDSPGSLAMAISRHIGSTEITSLNFASDIWRAPEMPAIHELPGAQGDIYSLGLLAVFMLTSAIPSRKIGRQLEAVNTPQVLVDLIDSMVEDDPSRRISDATQLLSALADVTERFREGGDGGQAAGAGAGGAYMRGGARGITRRSGIYNPPTPSGSSRAAWRRPSPTPPGPGSGVRPAIAPRRGDLRDQVDATRLDAISFRDHGRSTVTAAAIDDKGFAYTGDADGAVFAWNTYDTRRRWKARLGEVVTALIQHDENVYVATAQGNLHKLDRNFGVSADRLALGRPITALAVHRGRGTLLIGLADGRMKLIDLAAAKPLSDPATPHRGAITALLIHEDRDIAYSAGTDGVVSAYRLNDNLTTEHDVPVSRKPLRALTLMLNGKNSIVAAGGDDGVVYVSPVMGETPGGAGAYAMQFDVLVQSTAVGFPIRGLATTHGYNVLFAGGASRLVRAFSVANGTSVAELEGLPGQAYVVHGNDRSPLIIAGGEHGGLHGWLL